MKTQLASLVSIVLGALLLCVLIAWTQFLDDDSYWWSEQQGREFSRAAKSEHHHHPTVSTSTEDSNNDAADRHAEDNARFADALRDLQHARDRRNRTTLVLKWAGIGLIAAGAFGYFASRAAD
jgi:hypothetical protein